MLTFGAPISSSRFVGYAALGSYNNGLLNYVIIISFGLAFYATTAIIPDPHLVTKMIQKENECKDNRIILIV